MTTTHAASDNPPPAWRDEYPFASHWLTINGRRLHYVDEGPRDAAETLLLVHGNPTWSFMWRRLIQAESAQRRCIAIDHLGCGLSDLQPRPLRLGDHIDNLSQLVVELDLRDVTLIGHDWGGAIGLGTLLAQRDRFRRLVLLNTGAYPPWSIPWRIRVCRWPVIGRLAVQGANAFSRAALSMTLAKRQRLSPAAADGFLAPYNTWRRRAAVYQFVRDIPGRPSHPTWQTLAHLEHHLAQLTGMPKLLVWGEADWCFTPECLTRFTEIWPDADVFRLPGVGHWVLEDAPDETLAAVARFLDQTQLAATPAMTSKDP